MKNRAAAVLLAAYRLALPGYHYEFPRDHFNHPDFQTEWWYYIGNLHTTDGRRFGFELTFFRQGGQSSERADSNVWDIRDVWMAHLALSDIDGGQFLHAERLNRAGAGLAGADLEQRRVWNGNWRARWLDSNSQQLDAVAPDFSFTLTLQSRKPPVIHGKNGVSQKAAAAGRASHYVSLTRLVTSGEIRLSGKQFRVEGLSWMDHEFFTSQLDPEQTGWDWLSLQASDGSEIMLYRLRRKDGSPDPYSAGTYVDASGKSRFLSAAEFSLQPGKVWTSPDTGGRYPVEWAIRVPSLGLEASVAAKLAKQEIAGKGTPIPSYWEGAIDAIGRKQGDSLFASGYLEMTGYAGARPLQ
ncbi:MAG TPA: lipocalin-like domain-containing protein [Bryobacteraceae bacterium]|nr:lipocalin-like domain-containing protein [Bryobacteraceae bacterium]